MLSTQGVLKSDITINTIVPGEPSEGFNVIDGFCAFANGIIANGRANMLRKNIISVALPNLLLILTENFIEIAASPKWFSLIADIRFEQTRHSNLSLTNLRLTDR